MKIEDITKDHLYTLPEGRYGSIYVSNIDNYSVCVYILDLPKEKRDIADVEHGYNPPSGLDYISVMMHTGNDSEIEWIETGKWQDDFVKIIENNEIINKTIFNDEEKKKNRILGGY